MFCPHCSKEIKDDSKFCPYCGQKIDSAEKEHVTPEVVNSDGTGEKKPHTPAWTLGLLSIIFGAVTFGTVGLVLGIIGLVKSTTQDEKTMNIIGIVVSAVAMLAGTLTRIYVKF